MSESNWEIIEANPVGIDIFLRINVEDTPKHGIALQNHISSKIMEFTQISELIAKLEERIHRRESSFKKRTSWTNFNSENETRNLAARNNPVTDLTILWLCDRSLVPLPGS